MASPAFCVPGVNIGLNVAMKGASPSNSPLNLSFSPRSLGGIISRHAALTPPRRISVRAVADVQTRVKEEEETLARKSDSYFTTDKRSIILFDGVCNFCNAGVNFMLDNDKAGKFRMAALQSEAGRTLLARSGRHVDDISSIILVQEDRSFIKSEAVLRIGMEIAPPIALASTLAILLPSFVRDVVYDAVADNRYRILGMRKSCRMSDGSYSDRFVQ
eukprot:TRINITY_DN1750_c0_g1_i1.p1 TRINITY_DN1750_c0_g1~~TRINITY_DN1750_c0_g1_i1.p1  ORF type:complete len:217 (-),score=53.01 TRINITY_DN1750_c0_g1_i1:182-832(-)